MKRSFIFLIGSAFVLLNFILAYYSWNEMRSVLPKAGLRFVGFAQDPYGKPEARFLLTNYSARITWDVAEMSKKTRTGWTVVGSPSEYRSYAPEPLPSAFEIGVPVSETNGRWQVIFRINEKTSGLPGMIDSFGELFDKIKTGVPEKRYLGRMYYVTNEISDVDKE